MELAGKTVLVTGAGHRVGRAIAVALGAQKMQVAVHYNATADGAKETLREIQKRGGSGDIFGADLTKPDQLSGLVDSVVKRFGALDVLVNSAAVMLRTPLGETKAEEWDKIMALNLRAPFLLSQAAAPHLRRAKGGGVIVNIADLAAFETWPAYLVHGQSKSGVVYLTRALARVLAPEVRVGAVAPGTVLLPEGWSAAGSEHLVETTPLRRNGTPEDVSNAVLFILGADYFTGDTIIVDGGRHIRK
jgi:NAD(P)-dependent dehydrogenase (short-subunit alcohol dehydrogenase family)